MVRIRPWGATALAALSISQHAAAFNNPQSMPVWCGKIYKKEWVAMNCPTTWYLTRAAILLMIQEGNSNFRLPKLNLCSILPSNQGIQYSWKATNRVPSSWTPRYLTFLVSCSPALNRPHADPPRQILQELKLQQPKEF